MKIKLAFIVIIFLMIPTVKAGVGIVYGKEYLKAEEEGITCVSYGIYNPWSKDADVLVYTSGTLVNITQNTTELYVPEGTKHNQAIQAQICFEIPKIYKEDCLFWKIGCKKNCNEEQVEYSGEIIASEITEGSGGGTGSKVTGAVTAPLTVRVQCEEKERDIFSILGLLGLIIFAIISAMIWNNYREPPVERRRKKAEKLKKKKEKLERKIKEV